MKAYIKDGNSSIGLEAVLCADELRQRSHRPPDYKLECEALANLLSALSHASETILQIVSDTILEIQLADSAGVSLLEAAESNGEADFRWAATSGRWKSFLGNGTPRSFGPCRDVLHRNAPLLFRHLESSYKYFESVKPPVEECLLVPFYVEEKAVGMIWAAVHDHGRRFDSEDLRLMQSLAKFSSCGYQVVKALEESERAEQTARVANQALRENLQVRLLEIEEAQAQLAQQNAELKDVSASLLQLKDDERRRIARELHDSTGALLTMLTSKLGSLAQSQRSSPVAGLVQDTQSLVQQIDKEVRTASYLLHPPLLDDKGLRDAMLWYAEALAKGGNLQVEIAIPIGLGRLPRDMELGVFRILQECLTNVQRHSDSKTASIRISRNVDSISMEVEDRGKGMSANRLAEVRRNRGGGLGLRGIRERVLQFGGTMHVDSNSNGTKLLFQFPVAENNAEPHPKPLGQPPLTLVRSTARGNA